MDDLDGTGAIRWSDVNMLPNIAFIRSRRGHQTIADVMIALLNSSPLWTEHLARIDVHALSSPRALAEGLGEALRLCRLRDQVWVVALVRGGGRPEEMKRFASTLLSDQVRPLLERIAPRLVFGGGHTRDATRYEWLRPQCLAFGVVPLDAASQFIARLSAEGVLRRAHDGASQSLSAQGGLPLPQDLHRVNHAREMERLAQRIRWRQWNRETHAPVLDDREFLEVIFRGGILVGFRQITGIDYRAFVISQDYITYGSDSYYDLAAWRDIFESAGVEEWEIDDAMGKAEP